MAAESAVTEHHAAADPVRQSPKRSSWSSRTPACPGTLGRSVGSWAAAPLRA